ncbi:MAG TPA: bacterial transcriptional activator domain-containing protein, partial [Chthonomonadaceae bacterium]|nr:bacterial transcriptional activator domain-containing protein [Chthonomonadaceae bacterium]
MLTKAVDGYRGDLLPGYYEAWNLGEREQLAAAHLEAMLRLIPLLEQVGDLARAAMYARQAVQSDPLRKSSHQNLIRLYTATGLPAAALRQYQILERILFPNENLSFVNGC